MSPPIQVILIFAAIVIFVKFCGWARRFTISAAVKKWLFILTGVGLVVCNVLFSLTGGGFVTFEAEQPEPAMTLVLIVSLVLVFMFAFALMSEKAE